MITIRRSIRYLTIHPGVNRAAGQPVAKRDLEIGAFVEFEVDVGSETVVGQAMTDGGTAWAGEVVRFLSDNIPRNSFGFDHMATSAYEMGCQALAKLGQIRETERGGVAIENPILPAKLPRWDDICVVVLNMAHQQGLIEYLKADSSSSSDATKAPDAIANVAPANNLGAAFARPEVLTLLYSLGLVKDGCWRPSAETVLWRELPDQWHLDFEKDQLFIDAVEGAASSIPDSVRARIDELVYIPQEKLDDWIAGSVARYEKELAVRAPSSHILQPDTLEQAQRRHYHSRRWDLDWVLFTGWRLGDGWLSPEQAEVALDIFHDPLAQSMRAAVMTRAYPTVSWAAL